MSIYTSILTRSLYTVISVPANMGKLMFRLLVTHVRIPLIQCLSHMVFLCDSKVSKAVEREHSTIILNNDCFYPVCRGGKR